MSKPLTPKERVERVLTSGGKFPDVLAFVEAAVKLNRRTVEKILKRYWELPEPQRHALGVGANLLLSVLENRLKTLKKVRKKK